MGRTFTVSVMTKHLSLSIGAACANCGAYGAYLGQASHPPQQSVRRADSFAHEEVFLSCVPSVPARSTSGCDQQSEPSNRTRHPHHGRSLALVPVLSTRPSASFVVHLLVLAWQGPHAMVTSSVVDLVSANLRIRTFGCWITTLGVWWLWSCPSLVRRSRASFTVPATFGAFLVSFSSSLSFVGPSAWFVGRWWCAGRAFGPSSRWFRR